MRFLPVLLLLTGLPLLTVTAQGVKAGRKRATEKRPEAGIEDVAAQSRWAPWVEPQFPFFSSVLDARQAGDGFPKDNLTPRGLILNLGHDLWACFDTDLLRIACIWRGEAGKPPVTPVALAPGSYHVAGQKTKDGQDDLPKPAGKVWLATGIHPGWQVLRSPEERPRLADPREPAPSPEEPGRGPLDEKLGRFISLSHTEAGSVRLAHEVGGMAISEWFQSFGEPGRDDHGVRRTVSLPATKATLALHLGRPARGLTTQWIRTRGARPSDAIASGRVEGSMRTIVIPPRDEPTLLHVFHLPEGAGSDPVTAPTDQPEPQPARRHWPQTVTTRATLSQKDDAYVVDDIPLPLDNPWKRNVRLADLAFLDDQGNAAAVTMDGDVWLISGLEGDMQEVKWRRFASGLHEPMAVVARPGSAGVPPAASATSSPQAGGRRPRDRDIFVFDRNGVWRLLDTNHDGECDVHEMFCNRFAQTAETREFPNSMKLAPDGSFVLSKGGQQGATLGKHNGTALRVSPDGRTIEVLGYGLRQPFVGVHPRTGLVVASDQEGNYVPTTPIQIIRDRQFYGHLATIQPHEQYPQTIADPLTWIPHAVVPSGATLTWLADARMGSVNDELVLVSYNKPELHRVIPGSAGISPAAGGTPALPGKPQAAIVPWIRNLEFPTLNAHVNPADGQLYAIGFQIWGTTVKRISGLARIRYTGKPRILLTGLTPCEQGVLLRFNEPLDKTAATQPDNYNVERWNYKRTFNYGSPHLRSDGTPGQEWMVPSSAYLSRDGKRVFIGLPDMKNTYMQMRVGWGLKGADGLPAQNNAYFTPHELERFHPEDEGFEKLEVDLTPRKAVAVAQARPTREEGERLYQMMGCVACHSTDGTLYGKVGPSWKGLYGSERVLAKGGGKSVADDAYLRESIQNPPAKVVRGFEKLDAGMPVYAGVLNDSQIESLILFIKSLK